MTCRKNCRSDVETNDGLAGFGALPWFAGLHRLARFLFASDFLLVVKLQPEPYSNHQSQHHIFGLCSMEPDCTSGNCVRMPSPPKTTPTSNGFLLNSASLLRTTYV